MQLKKMFSAIVLLQFDKNFQKNDHNKLHLPISPKLSFRTRFGYESKSKI